MLKIHKTCLFQQCIWGGDNVENPQNIFLSAMQRTQTCIRLGYLRDTFLVGVLDQRLLVSLPANSAYKKQLIASGMNETILWWDSNRVKLYFILGTSKGNSTFDNGYKVYMLTLNVLVPNGTLITIIYWCSISQSLMKRSR